MQRVSSNASSRSPGETDSGLLLRALELLEENGRISSAYGSPHGQSRPPPDVHALARAIGRDPRVAASVEHLTASELAELAREERSALARLDRGWAVVLPGSARVVSSAGERTLSPRSTVRLAPPDRRLETLVVEPRLALDSLAAAGGAPRSPWSRLHALMSLEAPLLWTLVAYAVVLGALSLAVPVAVQVLVNSIALGSLMQPLVILSALLGGVLALSAAMQAMQLYTSEVLQRRLFVRLAEDVARRLPRADAASMDGVDPRELANRFFEVTNLQKATGRLLVDGLGLVLQTGVGLLLLAFYHPILLAFDLALVAALVLVFVAGYGGVDSALKESTAKYRVAAWLQNVAANHALFARPSGGDLATRQADALTRDYLKARKRHYRVVLRQLLGGLVVQVLAMVALLGVGGWLVMRGELTLGQLVAAELVVGAVGIGFAKLGKHIETGYDLLASVHKIGQLVDVRLGKCGPIEHGAVTPAASGILLRLDSVSVSGRALADELPLSSTCRVHLASSDDTWRSRALQVLAGLRPPDHGSIRIVGEATDDVELRSLAFLVRSRDVSAGTVLDNLRLAEPTLTTHQAREYLEEVFLGDAVRALPHGLDTVLAGDGAPLSPAQVARLALARGMAARPRLLLLDGVLDAHGLDERRAKLLRERVLGPDAPWAAVVASTDPAVAALCSESWRVVES